MPIDIRPAEREREQQIRSVACPVCEAQPGKACRERSGRGSYPLAMAHTGRMRVWEEQR